MNQSNLPSRFENNLKNQRMIFPGESVLIACSGGPDSVALFHLLRLLQEKWKFRLGLMHFNHRLRGRDSDRDEQFVKKMAREFKIPFYSAHGNVKQYGRQNDLSPEEAAREMRYAFFAKAAKKYRISKIAFAHTQDDQAETVLMRVLQGTGLRGLAGILPVMEMKGTVCVRPLLGFSKRELLLFLKENKISFCRDSSNRSLRFLRNRIRWKLFPQLVRDFNPRAIEALARIPGIVKEENELLAAIEQSAWKRVVRKTGRGKLYFDRKVFLKFPAPLQFRILNRALRKMDERSGIHFDAWHKAKVGLARPHFRYSLPKDIDLLLSPSKMMVCKKFLKG